MRDEFNPASLISVFLQESEEGLTAMEQALMALDAHPEAAEPLNEVFRIAHTIKGGAAMVEFPAVAEFAHKFEDALTMFRDGLVSVTTERVTVMLQIADVLGAMIKAQSAGQAVRVRAADAALVARLIPLELHRPDADAADRTDDMEQVVASGDGTVASSVKTHSLRVEKSKLDVMLTLSGEIAVAKGRLMQVLTAAGVG